MAPLPLEHDYIGLSESPDEVSATFAHTELRIGLPGSESEEWMDGAGLSLTLGLDNGGFSFSDKGENAGGRHFRPAKAAKDDGGAEKAVHSAKAQVVGWPPIRSYRANTMAANPITNNKEDETQQGVECLFIKVSMDGAPYLRKVDLKTHSNYKDLSLALEKMLTCFTIGHYGSHGKTGREVLTDDRAMDLLQGSGYVLTNEDKDEDWMLVGDVPWKMFTHSCRRLRMMLLELVLEDQIPANWLKGTQFFSPNGPEFESPLGGRHFYF